MVDETGRLNSSCDAGCMNVKSIISTYCPGFLRPTFNRIEGSPLGYRLAKGMFWSVTGVVISRALTLAAMMLVARILGRTVYGEFGMIQSTAGMFGTFAGFGLGLTATKYVAEYRLSDPARAGRIIGLSEIVSGGSGGLMALCLFLFAPFLAERAINAPHLAGPLRVGALMLLLSALNGAQTGALSGFEAFRTIARVNLFSGLMSFPVLVAGAWLGGLIGVVWAVTFNLCFNWLLDHLALRGEARRFHVPFAFKGCGAELATLWKFSLPAVLAASLIAPINWACGAMLVNRPGGYGEMGVFSAAYQWFGLVLFLPSMLGNVVLPVLSERLGQDDVAQSIRTIVFGMRANAVLVLPLILLASAASPYVMELYGDGFRSGWPTLVVVLLTAGVYALQTPVGQVIVASGRMWMSFVMNAGWALVLIVGALALVRFGSFGLALAGLLSYTVQSAWIFGFASWVMRRAAES